MSLLAALVVALFLIPMLASRRRHEDAGYGRPAGDTQALRGLGGAQDGLASLRARAEGRRTAQNRSTAGVALVIVYSCSRFVISSLLELVGKLLLVVVFGLVWVGRKLLLPVVRRVFGGSDVSADQGTQALLDVLHRAYPRGLRWALRSPMTILIVGRCLLRPDRLDGLQPRRRAPAGGAAGRVHRRGVAAGGHAPRGDRVDHRAGRRRDPGREGHIESLLLTVGYDAANSNRSDEGEHTARFKVLLDVADPRVEDEVIDRLRERFAAIPDLEAQVTRPVLFSFKSPIEVEVHGDDLVVLRRQAEAARDSMARMPELADVETTLRRGAPEVQVIYDRDRLARYDLNPQTVARLVRDQVQGFEATRYNLKDRRIPIVVRLQIDDRETVEDVRSLIVNPGGERPISLERWPRSSWPRGPARSGASTAAGWPW